MFSGLVIKELVITPEKVGLEMADCKTILSIAYEHLVKAVEIQFLKISQMFTLS